MRVAVAPEVDVRRPAGGQGDEREGGDAGADHDASATASAIALNDPWRIIPGIVLSWR
jgi:hypothetical protein